MIRRFVSFVFIFCICTSALAAEEYLVKRAVDGDTIELSTKRLVRYIGIDTPEVRKKAEGGRWEYKPEPFGMEAAEFNRKLVEGKRVRLEYDVQKNDKHGRTLAYVYLGDEFINAKLIEEGYAKVMTIPPNVKCVELFRKLEREAREGKRGLWR